MLCSLAMLAVAEFLHFFGSAKTANNCSILPKQLARTSWSDQMYIMGWTQKLVNFDPLFNSEDRKGTRRVVRGRAGPLDALCLVLYFEAQVGGSGLMDM